MWAGFSAVTTAVAIALLPLLPSEHVHEVTGRDGHSHVYAHRHVASGHKNAANPTPTFEDHDQVLTIAVAVAQPAQHYSPDVVFATVAITPDSDVRDGTIAQTFSHPIHGPPVRVATPRAPPVSTFR